MANKKNSSTKKKSTTITTKKVAKSATKMAKKNPKGFIILILLLVLLGGLGVGGYFAYLYFVPKIVFELNGNEEEHQFIDSTYAEKGVIATYNGKDISNEVITTYYLNNEKQQEIKTDDEATYIVNYDLEYQRGHGHLERKVIISGIDFTFELKGNKEVSVALNSTYVEPGITATYNGKDISNEVVISYYLNDEKQQEIKTDAEATYTINYDIDYRKAHGHIERKVNITDVEAIDINFLELGNKYTGDSTFIKVGDTDILIDAGSRANSATTIANYIDTYCTDGKLEYVIATHAHQDHIAGFVGSNSDQGIFKRYKIDTLIDFSLTNATSAVYNNYVSLRDEKIASGDIAHHYTANECIQGTNGAKKSYEIAAGITMEILDQKFYREKTSDENDYSVCALFTQGNNHYLFTGDLEKDGEASLVALNNLPEVELFKGGHHGSYTANTDTLLDVIKPKTICICCCAGSDEYTDNPDNMFPAQLAINRMAKHTDKIYVTTVVSDNDKGYISMNGNITFHSQKGQEFVVNGSNNSTILKETAWFIAHRTWPTY